MNKGQSQALVVMLFVWGCVVGYWAVSIYDAYTKTEIPDIVVPPRILDHALRPAAATEADEDMANTRLQQLWRQYKREDPRTTAVVGVVPVFDNVIEGLEAAAWVYPALPTTIYVADKHLFEASSCELKGTFAHEVTHTINAITKPGLDRSVDQAEAYAVGAKVALDCIEKEIEREFAQ